MDIFFLLGVIMFFVILIILFIKGIESNYISIRIITYIIYTIISIILIFLGINL